MRRYRLEDFQTASIYKPRTSTAAATAEVELTGGRVIVDPPISAEMKELLQTPRGDSYGGDPSKQDFHVIQALLEADLSPADAAATFMYSPRGKDVPKRKPGHVEDYVRRTVSKAAAFLEQQAQLSSDEPHDRRAERAVLGAILQDNATLTSVRERLLPGDFSVPAYRVIFQTAIGLAAENQPVDAVTVGARLEGEHRLKEAALLDSLVASVPDPARAALYADSIKEKAGLRHLARTATKIKKNAGARGAKLVEVVSTAIEFLSQLAQAAMAEGGPKLRCFDLTEFLKEDLADRRKYLVAPIILPGSAVLVYALPKNLKSFFVLQLALDVSIGRAALGYFKVGRPVRVLVVQIEDPPAEVQRRLATMVRAQGGRKHELGQLVVIPRLPINLMDAGWRASLEQVIAEQKTELLILDVLRRFFRGNINSAEDTAAFLEVLDGIRARHNCAILLVHHSRKDMTSDVQTAALGSTNIAAWADTLIQFRSKRTTTDNTATVELEIETKFGASSTETLVFDPNGKPMLRVQAGASSEEIARVRASLKAEWTLKDLQNELRCSESTASRRVNSWLKDGRVVKAKTGPHGLALYRFSDRQKDLDFKKPEGERDDEDF